MDKLKQYKVIKLNSSKIKELCPLVEEKHTNTESDSISDIPPKEKKAKPEYDFNLTYEQAIKNVYIISISESQLTRHLESMKCVKNKLSINKKGKPLLNGKGEQQQIRFISDIVLVHFDDDTVFTKMRYKNLRVRNPFAFIFNGNKYSRLFVPSSNGRKGTIIFVNNKIKDELLKKCMNGFDSDLSKIVAVPAKFSAYIGLCVSGSRPVSTPRVCVIPDLDDFSISYCSTLINEKEVKPEDINNYSHNFELSEGETGEGILREDLRNCFDGMGLVDPAYAKDVWKKDLKLDYTPCGWVVRCAFIKGALFNFNFKLLAKKYKVTFIKDMFGKQHNINDIDVILTKSQFKMWKQYHALNEEKSGTWEFYQKCCDKNNNTWGISKVNPKDEKEFGNLNYQFLQTLNLEENDIINMCQTSKDYLDDCINNPDKAFELIAFKKGGELPAYAQAVKIYKDAIKDPFIKGKIFEAIEGQIKEMCLGRLRIRGNYQFIINDPVALCEWAFFRDKSKVKGLLKKDEYYSRYWLINGINKVSGIRAPNIHYSEHNTLDFVYSDDMEKWYSHLYSGIIYNIYGEDSIRHSGSDEDGDLVFCTPSDEMLKGTVLSPVIDFEHKSVDATELTEKKLFEADKNSFETNIGITVNLATICINMKSSYEKDSPEYKELEKREKILTFIGQETIDAAKGCKVSVVPEYWYKYQPSLTEAYYEKTFSRRSMKKFNITLDELRIKADKNDKEYKLFTEYEIAKNILDTPEIISKKEYNNRLLLDRKPYFFIYKDKPLKQEYNDYLFSLSLPNPGINPTIENNSIMNIVCKEIERYFAKISKDCKDDKADKTWIELMKDSSVKHNEERFKKVSKVLRAYNAAKQLVHSRNYEVDEDKIITNIAVDDCYCELLLNEVESESELANYLIELLYEKSSKSSKGAVWKFTGDTILKNIKRNLEVVNGQKQRETLS